MKFLENDKFKLALGVSLPVTYILYILSWTIIGVVLLFQVLAALADAQKWTVFYWYLGFNLYSFLHASLIANMANIFVRALSANEKAKTEIDLNKEEILP